MPGAGADANQNQQRGVLALAAQIREEPQGKTFKIAEIEAAINQGRR
jgi:hypothetical protein